MIKGVLAVAALIALAPPFVFLRGYLQYKGLEKSVTEKMDQYYLNITTPGREEYLLQDDELFEVPYMASKQSVAPVPTRIYGLRGELIGEYATEKGLYARDPDDLPPMLKRALVATEDGEFYKHHGVNCKALARAMLVNLRSLRLRQGGSTLTQQLAKIMFTTRKKTAGRKIFELFCARKLEAKFTKDQILLMYLNFAYFGHGCFGVESAARFYFGRPAKALELGQAAMLAGMIASPNNYSPLTNPALARARHHTVLRRMAKDGYIPVSDVDRFEREFWESMAGRLNSPDVSFWRMNVNEAPYVVEEVRRALERGYPKERILRGGLKVYATIDLEIQKAAEEALKAGLKRENGLYARNHPVKNPGIEGAVAVVRPEDGAILAMVGGASFNFQNQLNRAASIHRPIGSSVKPFIYAEAFAAGFKPEDQVVDEPVHFKIPGGRNWNPHNYEGKYYGRVTLEDALRKSLNSVAIRLLQKVDIGEVVRLLADASGAGKERIPRNLSLALGTAELSPVELAAAYAIFANGGRCVRPYLIARVEDRDGKVLEEAGPAAAPPKRVLDEKTIEMTRRTMEGTLREGGSAYQAAKAIGFNVPAAGKTGTTNEYRDAWFAGVTPDLSGAAWVGFDDMRRDLGKGRSGGAAAAPIWLRCVKDVYRNRPTREFGTGG